MRDRNHEKWWKRQSRQTWGHSHLILVRLAPTQCGFCFAAEALQGCRKGPGEGRDNTNIMACDSVQVPHSHKTHTVKDILIIWAAFVRAILYVPRNVSLSSGYDRGSDPGWRHLSLQSVVWVNCCKIWKVWLQIHFLLSHYKTLPELFIFGVSLIFSYCYLSQFFFCLLQPNHYFGFITSLHTSCRLH